MSPLTKRPESDKKRYPGSVNAFLIEQMKLENHEQGIIAPLSKLGPDPFIKRKSRRRPISGRQDIVFKDTLSVCPDLCVLTFVN